MHIFCDFDGTISLQDTTDVMLNRFASAEWRDIESRWESGAIGSSECMTRQIALISANRQELDEALADILIDATFKTFVTYCQDEAFPLTIISDGVDYFIRNVLALTRLEHLPVVANHLIFAGQSSYRLEPATVSRICASGVCKCFAVSGGQGLRVYIGDGRSDFCVADKVDVVFAKHALAEYCESQRIPYIPFRTFNDIRFALTSLLAKQQPAAVRSRTNQFM